MAKIENTLTLTRIPALSSANGNGHGIGLRPSTLEPEINYLSARSESCRPIGVYQRFAIMCDVSVLAAVSSLFASCGPSNIFRAIITFIINPLKGVARRWWQAHIGKKVGEIFPAVTDLNPASTVVFIVRTVCVIAPLKHRPPSAMDFRSRVSVFSDNFKAQTSTRFSGSVAEGITENGLLRSTVAPAKPLTISSAWARRFNDSKITQNHPSSEPFSSQIFANTHMTILSQSPVFMGVKA
jgi:hypothetical protein